MRPAVTTTALLAVLWILAAPRAAPPVPPARPEPDWIAAASWAVLCPRGAGTSPTPIVAFVTPGWLGPVEVTIETRARTIVCMTSGRTLAWPESLGALGVGEWCAVTVAGSSGKRAAAAYLRSAPEPEFPPSATMARARG